MKTISLLAIGIMVIVTVVAPLTLVLSQQALAADNRDKVIRAANEGKDKKFQSKCVKAGGSIDPDNVGACVLPQN
jgi:hypothetical protein